MIKDVAERIQLLEKLGAYLISDAPELEQVIQRAYQENKWFTKENSQKALRAISEQMLKSALLKDWANHYDFSAFELPKDIGIVMAGNLPLVGFQDFLCVFMAGYKAQIKLSEKDSALPLHVFQKLSEQDKRFRDHIEITERLKDFDAVIATGSNNTSRYFEAYFGKYPNIIRKSRTSVAVLDGSESDDDLRSFGRDIFDYFGLGCRNISKLYLPVNYQLDPLLEILHEFKAINMHNKYKNNFDYNMTLFILNKIQYISNGSVMMVADKKLHSRIASLHYEFYESKQSLINELQKIEDQIQVISSNIPLDPLKTAALGEAQNPGLFDYPDHIDVMDFLASLK